MFTNKQLELMTKVKKRVNWTVDEIATGFALSYLGSVVTISLATNWVYSFFHSNVAEIGRKIRIAPGILRDCFTVIIRGLFSKLEQPVFADFDVKVTLELITTLTHMFDAIGFNVVTNKHQL